MIYQKKKLMNYLKTSFVKQNNISNTIPEIKPKPKLLNS